MAGRRTWCRTRQRSRARGLNPCSLILGRGRSAESALAAVYAEQARQIAESPAGWRRQGGDNEKIVWLLDHCCSEAGPSLDALKGVDAAVAGVLSEAAARARCDLLAAILHLFGIDHTKLTYRFQGHDFRLTDVHGKVVTNILA